MGFALCFIAALGIVALYAGWRGTVVDEHPRCHRCGYDLFGAGAPGFCPECGRDLSRPGAVTSRRRRRQCHLVAAGALLLAATAGWQGWRAYKDVSAEKWDSMKPLWWLKRESTSSSAARAARARDEMLRRLASTVPALGLGLSEAEILDLVEHALTLQADARTPWTPDLGVLIERAWARDKKAHQQQLGRYLGTAMDGAVKVTTRTRIQPTGPLPICVEYGPCRVAAATCFEAWFSVLSATLGEWSMPRGLLRERWNLSATEERPDDIVCQVYAEPGVHVLRLRFHTSVYYCCIQERLGPLAEWTSDISIPVTVVAQDEETVEVIGDAEQAPRVRAAMNVGRIWLDRDAHWIDLPWAARANSLPIDFAFNVGLRHGDECVTIGELTVVRGRPNYRTVGGNGFVQRLLGGQRTADLVLRPSTDVAKCTVDIFRLWGRELAFEDVPVEWSVEEPDATTPTSFAP